MSLKGLGEWTLTVQAFGGIRKAKNAVWKPGRVREFVEEHKFMAPRLYATRR